MIARRKKTIETRSWFHYYKGRILICASRSKQEPGAEPPYGMAVAVARIVGYEIMEKRHEINACCPVYEGAYAWMLEDVRAIEPFPVTGRQGIFYVEVEEDRLNRGPNIIDTLF